MGVPLVIIDFWMGFSLIDRPFTVPPLVETSTSRDLPITGRICSDPKVQQDDRIPSMVFQVPQLSSSEPGYDISLT